MRLFRLKRTFVMALIVALGASFGVLLTYNAVDNSLTSEDEKYIRLILAVSDISDLKKDSYEEQIALIKRVQDAVFHNSSEYTGIPAARGREPKDLYQLKQGLCYDRSRVIEKSLRFLGFDTRHIYLYATSDSRRFSTDFFSLELESHAVTEVMTEKGWLVVDSYFPWIALSADNSPISIEEIRTFRESFESGYAKPLPLSIYKKTFSYVIGLYSRHGLYYPPYNRIPDIHYGEFLQNF